MELTKTKKHLDEIYTCNRTRCGFCTQRCPIYEVMGLETYCSRGRNLVLRGIIEGALDVNEEVVKLANTCLLCGYCEKNCALENTKILRDFKSDLVDAGLTDRYLEEGVKSLEEFGNPFKKKATTREIKDIKSNNKSKTLLFAGCTYSITHQETLKLMADLLDDVKYLGEKEPCCLNILWDSGHKEDFLKKKKEVVKILNATNTNELITGCPTCFRTFFEEYKDELKPKPVHFITKLNQMIQEGKIKFESKKKIKVTWHDPCHLGRFGKIIDEPREIIKSVKNVEFVEMANSGLDSHCCGAGSGMLMSYPEIAIEIAKRRYKEAEAIGVSYILTFCPTCEQTLYRGATTIARDEMEAAGDFDFDKEPEPKIKVMNLLEWLIPMKVKN